MANARDRSARGGVAEVLAGGGEMGALMRALDWASTPLGPVERWPQALRTCVRILLTSRQPMWLGWGEELTYLYNDAYRSIAGGKHPQALGQPTAVVWREIWADIEPRIRSALGGEEGTYDEALLLIMERHGYPEETYYTFSYSPIPDDAGRVAGIFCANTDDTRRVIGERRIALLRDLAAGTAEARTTGDAGALSMRLLEREPRDLPFALLYLVQQDQGRAVLTGASNLPPGHPAAPAAITLDGPAPWPLTEVIRTGVARLDIDLEAVFDSLPTGAWDRPPARAAALPIATAGQAGAAGVLIAGLNPYRPLDGDYQGFLELVAGQIGAAIGDARAYEEERRRAEALAELDRAKTVFFSDVSHELRTPLTLALGPVEEVLAEAGDALPAPDRERLQIAHRNHLRLLKLVNALLDFARIEAGRAQAGYEPTDLAALTADLASVFRSAVERAGLRLVVDCPPLPAPAYVDRDMWEKIVLNLLSNALKYTFQGEIAVTLRAVGDRVTLAVRDTGVGIAAEELPHIFERFHRVRGTRARTHEGAGIGLALVQELARLHGGTVEVASVVDKGTTFTVTIPTGAAHLPADRITPARAETGPAGGAALYVEDALRWLPEQEGDGQTPPGAFPAGTEGAGEQAARILLVDDNADMRAYVGRLLGARYRVEAAADGAAALEVVRAGPPDLVLSDVMMPGLDGFALLRELRADPRTAALPVILLSARAGEEVRAEGLEAGANDYLVKPFGARELMASVGAQLALAQARNLVARLQRLTAALSAAGTADQVAEAVIAHGLEALGASVGAVWQLSDDGATFTALRAVGYAPAIVAAWPSFPVDSPLPIADAVRAREPLILASPEERDARYPHLIGLRAETGSGALVAIPLLLGERAVGGLGLAFPVVRRFDTQERAALNALGELCAQALERARLYEAERAARADAEAERDNLQQVLDALPVGVVIADASGRFTRGNDAATALFGVTVPDRPVPRAEWDAYEEYGACRLDGTPYPSEELPLQRALWRGETVRGEQLLVRSTTEGRIVLVLANTAPLRDRDGAITGAVGVFQDITGLRELERAREEFLSSAAHDLKNPLTSVLGQAQLAQRRLARLDLPTAAPVLGQLARIQEGAETMLGLINELLDVTRQQMGAALELHREPVDLVGLVRIATEAQRDASGRMISLEAPPEVRAEVDAARIARVIGNLLSNAAKYSPDGSTIWVELRHEPGRGGSEAVIAVRDEGIGIPTADLPHIFDRFRRASNVAGHIQGTGIGLASARGIVEQHGGTIAVESAEGAGATFTVRLPLHGTGRTG